MIVRRCVAGLAVVAGLFLNGAPAGAAPAVGDPQMHAVAAALNVGAFRWADDSDGADAPVAIVVSTALQRLYVYRGDALVGVSTISTGRRGHSTPLGDFTVLQKARWHRSNIYSNAPMPFMQRLTWTGIALHAGHNPGFPASHGCVRLPFDFARDLFAMTSLGVPVTVADYPLQAPVYLYVEGFDMSDGLQPPRLIYAHEVFD